MFFNKNTFKYLLLYAGIRAFSYFCSPGTPLYDTSSLNTAVALIIAVMALYLVTQRDLIGWLIIAGELILGGSGGFLSVGPIALRTVLLSGSMLIFFLQKIFNPNRKEFFWLNRRLLYVTAAFLFLAFFSALSGYYHGNDFNLIFSDIIPYFYIFYALPLYDLWINANFRRVLTEMLGAAIIGNVIFIFLTFILFSGGVTLLQGDYYHWYRDVALGKITALPFSFYRLVLNEHLLLAPLLLLALGKIINLHEKEKTTPWIIIAISILAILSLNLTRAYLLALVIGLFCLFSRTNFRRWLFVTLCTPLIFISIFSCAHLIASKGQNFGWELFGLRLQGITTPQMDDSAVSRLLLLPEILKKIALNPIIGNGLGTTISVWSPVLHSMIITPHFDWGYLELWAETGMPGLIIWGAIIFFTFNFIWRNKRRKDRTTWVAALVGLMVINITSPALFHSFGFLFLAICLAPVGIVHVRSAGGIVMNRLGEIALVNQHGKTWVLPRGKPEGSEDSLSAAKREIYEETGLKNLKLISFIGDYERLARKSKSRRLQLKKFIIYLFETNEEGSMNPLDPKIAKASWIKPEEVNKVLTFSEDRHFFEEKYLQSIIKKNTD